VSSGYQRLVNVSFKIDIDLLQELDEYARSRGTNRSEIIRRAIAWYLRSYAKPSVTPRMTVYDASSNADGTSRIRVR
jgi:metal-responsive CopG/Arc/MetJ family transcriptional regulator